MSAKPQPAPPLPAAGTAAPGPPRLHRVLGMGDLVFYGLVLIQPVGAVGIFGLADQKSFGHVTLTLLIALAAMMLTAWSYGRMAGLYPAAGSAYTYVGRGLHPHCGFIAGWAMFLDYLVIPIVSIVYGALSTQKVVDALAPGLTHQVVGSLRLPFDEQRTAFVFWVVLFVALTTFLNVRGIKWTARTNQVLTAAMFLLSFSNVVYNINQVSYRQAICPVAIQGRMNATMRFIVWGTIPIGSVVGGLLATAVGVHGAVWIGAIGSCLPFLAVLLSPVRSLRSMPSGPALASAAD